MSGELPDPHGELAELVSAVAARLRWEQQRGIEWVSAAACPRVGPEPVDGLAASGPTASGPTASGPAASEPPDDVDPAAVVEPAPAGDASSAGGVAPALEAVRAELGDCQRCPLAAERRNLVFGVGDPRATLMFVGEAPGRDEDDQGEPFVGAAGRLLTRMIGAMGLKREEVYIANIIKCRPPRNRDPRPDEVAACEPFLVQQIAAIGPRMIVAMGNFACKTLLRTETGITRLRGNWNSYHGIQVMPTFHPAYLLRNPGGKRAAWDDLRQVMAEMDRLGLERRREPPRRRR